MSSAGKKQATRSNLIAEVIFGVSPSKLLHVPLFEFSCRAHDNNAKENLR